MHGVRVWSLVNLTCGPAKKVELERTIERTIGKLWTNKKCEWAETRQKRDDEKLPRNQHDTGAKYGKNVWQKMKLLGDINKKCVDSKYRQQNAGKPDKGKQTDLSSFHIWTLGNPWQVWQISVQGVSTYKWQVRSVVGHRDIWSVSCQQLDSELGIMWNMWLPDRGTEVLWGAKYILWSREISRFRTKWFCLCAISIPGCLHIVP